MLPLGEVSTTGAKKAGCGSCGIGLAYSSGTMSPCPPMSSPISFDSGRDRRGTGSCGAAVLMADRSPNSVMGEFRFEPCSECGECGMVDSG